MTIYIAQGIDRDLYVSMGEVIPLPPPQFVYETSMPVPFISERMGIGMESSSATARVALGEVFNTRPGDFVTVLVRSVDRNGDTFEKEIVQVDVGGGSEQMQTVAEVQTTPSTQMQPGNAPVVEEPIAIEQPFYSESAAPSNPYDPNSPAYVHPENPTQDVVFTPSSEGSTAPVTYQTGTGTSTYNPSPGSTSSPTGDLIGYGELDVNGNPVQVYEQDYSAYDAI